MKRTSRNPSKLSESLQRHLNAYALAASAAGVGMLALAQPAEAKIVYTPAKVRISLEHPLKLDLNHDGITEFSIFVTYFFSSSEVTWFTDLDVAGPLFSGNSSAAGLNHYAYALHAGRRIGNSLPFGQYLWMGARLRFSRKSGRCYGPWSNVKERYLGLRFEVKGQTHYGWARLNESCHPISHVGITAVLTGYAYETIANKPIITGKTKGPDVITLEPGSLGQLAAGRK
jgi:hypothetical protein